ncbi:DoxX family protein [Sphingomonas sp.]|uniref:DoxX family protein n=1 Tax=Sphingomonas sp. TaxID=28214 RepID=UPI003B3BDF40
MRGLLAALFLIAAIAHVARPEVFLRIVPAWVPAPRLTVVATGWCEAAGSVGLLWPLTRKAAAAMLALYAVCVFPANIKHALDYAAVAGLGPGWFYHGPRMLLQPLIVWACLFAGSLIDWPFRGRDQAAPPAPPPCRPPARRA